MATIDLIVLGMVKQKPLSAYDIQKLVEYRNISRWVKISTPSIYKKVIQLEEKGYLSGSAVKEGRMAEKTVYSLTDAGEEQFERLMLEIAAKPIYLFLDFNAVIVNLDSLAPVSYTHLDGERSGMGFTVMESFTDRLTVKSEPGKGTEVIMIKKLDVGYAE